MRLQRLESNVRQYEATIAGVEEKKWQAEDIAIECDASYARVVELADKLNENQHVDGGGGPQRGHGEFRNGIFVGGRRDFAVRHSRRRAGAADSLAGDPDAKAVTKMKSNLANYGTLRSWVSFNRLLDFIRAEKVNTKPIGEIFGKAEQMNKDASEAVTISQGLKPPSDATRNIQHDLAAAAERQAQIRSQVDRLMREAQQADDAAARQQQTRGDPRSRRGCHLARIRRIRSGGRDDRDGQLGDPDQCPAGHPAARVSLRASLRGPGAAERLRPAVEEVLHSRSEVRHFPSRIEKIRPPTVSFRSTAGTTFSKARSSTRTAR